MVDVDRDENLARFLGLPTEAEKVERRAKADAFLRSIFTGDIDFGAGPFILRSTVENECWFVPIRDDGRFELVNVEKGQHELLIWDVSKKDGRRTVRKGKGGQFLPVYFDEPLRLTTRQMSGRQLARSLPDKVNGLLVYNKDNDDEQPRELSSEWFPTLRSLADSVDIEEVLLTHGPIESAKLKQFQWLVDKVDDVHLHQTTGIIEGDVASIFTHADRETGTEHRPAEEMDGAKFFRMLIDDAELDGVVINVHTRFGKPEVAAQNVVLSRSFIHRLFEEEWCHLRVRSLVARSRDEVEEWLTINDFPADREYLEETSNVGQKLIGAASKTPSENWRWQETCGLQDPEYVRSPMFEIQPAPDSKPGFGRGPSNILCPGLLARELYISTPKGKDSSLMWRPGKWMLFGRMLTDDEVKQSQRRVRLAGELLKLLPPGKDQVPRDSMLTVRGADFVRRVPAAGTREWITNVLAQAQRYTSKWVWGG